MAPAHSVEPNAFRAFERAGWQNVAERYADSFGSLTTQAIGPLLDAVGAGPGVRLLDVASGPGYVAGAAAGRGASAVGVDFSTTMVASARRRFPAVDFREGDAEALPFPDAGPDSGFDAVVMNFGLLHLARPERALGEAGRVLRPRGRAAFTVWTKPEEAVAFGIVLRAIETHGNLKVPLPSGPPFFRFSDPAECKRVLLEAGFAEVQIRTVPQTWRLGSPDALFECMREATVRTAGLLRAQSPQALEAIHAAVCGAARAYQKADSIELPMPAVLASATKP